MKNKSLKRKQGNSLNELSSSFVEPSYSKITFRKKGHDVLEMSDIGEEEVVRSNNLSIDPPEQLNQSNQPGNNLEYPEGRKKRRMKKDINNELIVSKEGRTDVNGDEDKSIVELGAELESPELNCNIIDSFNLNPHKKKKKKKTNKNASEIHSHLTKEHFTGVNVEEQPVVGLGVGFESNELNNSMSGPDSRNGHELIVSKEGCADVNGDEVKSTVESGIELASPELNCSIIKSYDLNLCKKKKKKKNASGIPSHLTKEYFTDRNIDEQPVIDLGVDESNELSNSVSSSNSPNVFNKKKKKNKHISDETLHKLISSKEGFNNVKLDEDKVEGALKTGSPVKKSKTKHNKLKLAGEEAEVCILANSPLSKENLSTKKQKNNRLEIVPDDHLKNSSNEQYLERFDIFSNSPSKEFKRKHSQSEENVIGICDGIDSPLFKKKKKTQKLMDESCLNIYGNEQGQKGGGTENDFVPDSNDLINVISPDTDTFNFLLHSKNEREGKKLLDVSNLNMSDKDEFQDDRRDADNNEVWNDLNVAQVVQTAKKLKIKHKWLPSPKKKKKIRNNIESLRNRLLKEALSGTEESEDLHPKSSKLKARVEENDNTLCLLKKTISDKKEAENLTRKSSKLKNGVEENVVSLRKRLLKEAEDFPQKSSKLKTGVEENVDTLRKRLLKEAIKGVKEAQDLPQKSSKLKTGVEENVATIKNGLLKEAISGTKGAKVLTPKSSKIKTKVKESAKACLPNEVQKGQNKFDKNLKAKLQNKAKHKIKHKYKTNDIDLLTDILISKALEKMSSSNESHSSQENIDSLNVEAKGVNLIKYGTSENKIVKVKQLKSNLSEQRTIKVQEKQHKSEKEKMEKSLIKRGNKKHKSCI